MNNYKSGLKNYMHNSSLPASSLKYTNINTENKNGWNYQENELTDEAKSDTVKGKKFQIGKRAFGSTWLRKFEESHLLPKGKEETNRDIERIC